MFDLDHVALPTPDIPAAVAYYVKTFHAIVLYADESWAFLRLGHGKLALVKPDQHPGHIALRVDPPTLQAFSTSHAIPIAHHRDGTTGLYLQDPAGNTVELISYPPEPDPPT